MPKWVQVLESRRLFTATAAVLTSDVATINTEVAAMKAAVASDKSTATSILAALGRSLKSAETNSTRAADRNLFATLSHAASSGMSSILKAETTLATNASKLSKRGLADGKQLLAHPTKTSNQTKVNTDIAALNSIIPAKLSALQTAGTNALTAINTAFSKIAVAEPSLATTVITDQSTVQTKTAAVGTAGVAVGAGTTKLATDLGNHQVPAVTLTGLTFFRGDSTGDNQNSQGSVIAHGAWTSGLDVQNIPGNYGGEFFISKVPNPTAADFLTPAAISLALNEGANTFYFWADGDDTQGGSQTFGLNVFLNSSSGTTPTLSGYTVPGTGQTLNADSAAVTPSANFVVVPGAGTLSAAAGSTGTVTLSAFQILGVSGQGSTVDLVNSTNTAPFTPPPHADGIFDTYGTFTITVS